MNLLHKLLSPKMSSLSLVQMLTNGTCLLERGWPLLGSLRECIEEHSSAQQPQQEQRHQRTFFAHCWTAISSHRTRLDWSTSVFNMTVMVV